MARRIWRHVRREKGTAAIEFALVFVLFFMVMYGLVAFGLVFAVKHTITQAANEGARAAVKDVGGLDARIAQAKVSATKAVAWLGARAPVPQVTSSACAPFVCLEVVLVYNYAANPIVPSLPGLGVTLPATLTGRAIVQLDAVSN